MLSEMTRANDLKEKEMFMRTEGEWVEAKARPRPKYLLPPPQSTSTGKGGISLD